MKKSQINHGHVNHRPAFRAALMLLLLVIFCVHAAAQDQAQVAPSTDHDNPTPLAANVITGDGVDEKTEYFYSFPAGPGEVTITLDVKAEKGTAVSSVDIALFDAKAKKLMSNYANPDHGSSKRVVESVKVRGTQTLLLEVTVSQGVDNFKIKLDGALAIQPPTAQPTDTATPQPTTTPPPDPATMPSDPPSRGFYIVLTELASSKSIKSNTARVSAK